MGSSDTPLAMTSLDDAPCALARTAANGQFTHVNQTLCAWLGYTAEELTGRRFQDLLTMGGKIFHQTHWMPLLQMQGSVSEVRLEMLHQNGSKVPMVLNAARRESNGVFVHDLAAFMARDRDKFEQELVSAGKKLQAAIAEANRLKEEARDRALFAEQMVGIVSHDLRNPLSTITMGTTVLGRGDMPTNQQRVLHRISRAADRANRLITDLLDFTQARLGTGLGVNIRTMDLHAVIAETMEELSLAYPQRELRHLKLGEGMVDADPDRLAQLAGNLVSNAVAYGDPAAPVTVTTSIEGAAFSLTVHNFGKAIPADRLASLFQPMVRGSENAHSSRSVGLGLYIVSEIAKAHHGNVTASSDDISGTKFVAVFTPAAS